MPRTPRSANYVDIRLPMSLPRLAFLSSPPLSLSLSLSLSLCLVLLSSLRLGGDMGPEISWYEQVSRVDCALCHG